MAAVADAVLYDGLSARALAVTVTPAAASLHIAGGDDDTVIALANLRRGLADARGVTLHRTDAPDWRLVLPPDADRGWTQGLARHGSFSPAARRRYATIGLGAAAVIAALYAFGGGLLVAAAPLLPHRLTDPIGRGLVAQFGPACTAPAGRAVIDRLRRRLAPAAGFPEPVDVTVVDLPVVNAVALPGGHVVLFRKLIDQAQSGDEVAGVLAHEFGHVERRHPNQALIRQMGVSLLVRSLGGDTGGVVDLALLLQGSRAAEAQADDDAITALRRSGISPAPMAAFFDRQRQGKALVDGVMARIGDYAASHPADATRAARFRTAALAGAAPALTPADWQALRGICSAPKK